MPAPQPKPEDWILTNAQELRVSDKEVLAMLRAAYQEVNKDLTELLARPGTGAVRRAQLEQSRTRLLARQAEIFEKLGDIVSARRLRAAIRAQQLSAGANAALLDLVGRQDIADFLYKAAGQTSESAIDVAMARMGLSRLPLSQRIYRSKLWMDGRLGTLINAALAKGIDAKAFAKTARDWFNPNTPGGVRYAALRLARTEINNAFHAMTVQKAASTPWIPNCKWHLSKSHPKPDVCNTVAERDTGQGAGVYKSEAVPVRPHPQCMCFVTPESIEEDDFVDNFVNGDYDDYLDREMANVPIVDIGESTPPSPQSQDPHRRAEIPEVGATAQMSADQAKALLADNATIRQLASNKIYDEFAYGNLFNRTERGIDRREGVREYFANSTRINKAIRDGAVTSEIQHVIDEVDAAMKLTKTNEPIVVFRGVLRDLIEGKRPGDTISDSIFFSTALDPQQAKKFARSENSVLLHIELPSGTECIAENATETEVLLPRNSNFEIIRIDGDDVYLVATKA